ncbi:MAG: chemotaxis protein [Halomonas sp.]|nr:CZB domain-containing protein [Halomonas sp.]TVP45338.1 MAG: chemotaxis protein [Halomonas sp.]
MFIMHPYQKIRRLEQEVADLRAQLETAAPSPSCRLLSMMNPIQSVGILQAKGTDLLSSLNTGVQEFADQLAGERATLTDTLKLISTVEQAARTLNQRCQPTGQTESTPFTPAVLDETLHALSQLQISLARNAGHAQALAVSTALETAHSQGLLKPERSADSSTPQPPGLSAIADDLHRLALHSQQLSHQLSQQLENVNSQVREHSKAVALKRQADDDIKHSAQVTEQALKLLSDQARHMHKVIYHSATSAFLHSAKLDHAVWKSKLYKQLLSANTETPLEDHHQCRLGRWHLHGEDHRRYARTEAYRALAAPHRRMHESGAEALQFAQRGDHSGQMAALGVMEEASQQLAVQLDKLMEHAVYEAPYTSIGN